MNEVDEPIDWDKACELADLAVKRFTASSSNQAENHPLPRLSNHHQNKNQNQNQRSFKRPFKAIGKQASTDRSLDEFMRRPKSPQPNIWTPRKEFLCSSCFTTQPHMPQMKRCRVCKAPVSHLTASQKKDLLKGFETAEHLQSPGSHGGMGDDSTPNKQRQTSNALISNFFVQKKGSPALDKEASGRRSEPIAIDCSDDDKKGKGIKAGWKAMASKQRERKKFVLPESLKPMFFVDESKLETWIYPENKNFAVREYQRAIIETALFKNTLVVLPTGLGKTFIAAVVMFNYLRWFPDSSIIFMAPTRPLVSQQVRACHGIVGIPERRTALLIGTVAAAKRVHFWEAKNVFYCTPQTVDKDLDNALIDCAKVSLVVVDEAHRATGNYAYTSVLKKLHLKNPSFRVLALSATPGRDFNQIQEVLQNLFISKIEHRSEDDPDVKPYTFDKSITTIRVHADIEVSRLLMTLDSFIQPVLTRIVSAGFAPQLKGHVQRVSYGQAIIAFKAFQGRQGLARRQAQSNGHASSRAGLDLQSNLGRLAPFQTLSQKEFIGINSDYGLLLSLLHLKGMLATQGITPFLKQLSRSFCVSFNLASPSKQKAQGNPLNRQRNPQKPRVEFREDPGFFRLSMVKKRVAKLDTFKYFLRRCVRLQSDENSSTDPKIEKAIELLEDHFQTCREQGIQTSAIVFAQFRDTVELLCNSLKKRYEGHGSAGPTDPAGSSAVNASNKQPLRVSPFIGQSNSGARKTRSESEAAGGVLKGQTQKQQQKIVQMFRTGELDVLVATCIGEEGLDIGSVDLIICFDCLSSPVRMIQRYGRAGRKRSGKIYLLVSDAKEQGALSFGTAKSKKINQMLRQKKSFFDYFDDSRNMFGCEEEQLPRMVLQPIEIGEYHDSQLAGKPMSSSDRKKRSEQRKREMLEARLKRREEKAEKRKQRQQERQREKERRKRNQEAKGREKGRRRRSREVLSDESSDKRVRHPNTNGLSGFVPASRLLSKNYRLKRLETMSNDFDTEESDCNSKLVFSDVDLQSTPSSLPSCIGKQGSVQFDQRDQRDQSDAETNSLPKVVSNDRSEDDLLSQSSDNCAASKGIESSTAQVSLNLKLNRRPLRVIQSQESTEVASNGSAVIEIDSPRSLATTITPPSRMQMRKRLRHNQKYRSVQASKLSVEDTTPKVSRRQCAPSVLSMPKKSKAESRIGVTSGVDDIFKLLDLEAEESEDEQKGEFSEDEDRSAALSEDLDQDLESLIDNRPLSQLTLSSCEEGHQQQSQDRSKKAKLVIGDVYEHDQKMSAFHHHQLAKFSQSPVMVRRARKTGLNINTIEQELQEIKARKAKVEALS